MRTHRINAALIAGSVLLAASCGSSLTVEVTTEGEEGPQPQANVAVEFLPFDRDSVFDALDQEAETPRPQMSEELQAAQERVANLQEEWRTREAEWSEAREELRDLRARLDEMGSRSPGYREAFQQFEQLERTERRLNRERQAAFDSFTSAQNQVSTRLDSFRVVQETWANAAYADYFDIKTELLGGEEVTADTTNAQGIVTVSLPGGDWWAYARVPVPEGEMYWNVPVPDADTLRLNESNGELRPRL